MVPKSQDPLAIYQVLDEYEEAIDFLFEAIGSSNPDTASQDDAPSKLDVAVSQLIQHDQSLSLALDEVYQQQRNSSIITNLQEQSDSLDRTLYEIMTTMQAAHRTLLQSAKESLLEVPVVHETVPVDVLMAYANRIAKHTPNTTTNASASTTFSPWPSEDLMRRGVLAMGSMNMLKPGDNKKRGWHQGVASSSRTNSVRARECGPQSNGANTHAETSTKPVAATGAATASATTAPAASSAVALDLDLFDPDEEEE